MGTTRNTGNWLSLFLLHAAIATVARAKKTTVRSCKLSLYDGCDGDKVDLGLGEYNATALRKRHAGKRTITGLKIIGDEDCLVQLYDDDNYTGVSRTWKKSSSDFKDSKCHELQDQGSPDLTEKVKSIVLMRSPPAPQGTRAMWPDPTPAKFKDEYDVKWGETMCECTNDPVDVCNSAYPASPGRDSSERCEGYNNFVNRIVKCPTKMIRKSKSIVNKTDMPLVCGYGEKCIKGIDNNKLAFCVDKKQKLCAVRRFLGGNSDVTVDGGDNPVVAAVPCKVNGTCCDWDCCSDDEECVLQNSTMTRTSSSAFVANMGAMYVPADKAQFYYDFLGWDIDAVEANDWKLPGGANFKNRPRLCQKRKKFDPLQSVRTTLGPLIVLVFIVWVILSFMFKVRIKDAIAQTRTFPPLAVLVTSIFLAFSPALSYVIFTSVICVATLHWPHTKWNGWLALGQFITLWFLLGGTTVFTPTVQLSVFAKGYFNYALDQTTSFDQLQKQCIKFYGSDLDLRGMCSDTWIGFTLTVAQAQTALFAAMFLQSMINFLEPKSEPELWCCCKRSDEYLVDDNGKSNRPLVTLPMVNVGESPPL